jgi:hypothetical protein
VPTSHSVALGSDIELTLSSKCVACTFTREKPMNETRRAFLKGVAGKSLAAVGVTATAVALMKQQPQAGRAWKYAKPRIKSFMPTTTVHAYQAPTGSGTFTLKGTT